MKLLLVQKWFGDLMEGRKISEQRFKEISLSHFLQCFFLGEGDLTNTALIRAHNVWFFDVTVTAVSLWEVFDSGCRRLRSLTTTSTTFFLTDWHRFVPLNIATLMSCVSLSLCLMYWPKSCWFQWGVNSFLHRKSTEVVWSWRVAPLL